MFPVSIKDTYRMSFPIKINFNREKYVASFVEQIIIDDDSDVFVAEIVEEAKIVEENDERKEIVLDLGDSDDDPIFSDTESMKSYDSSEFNKSDDISEYNDRADKNNDSDEFVPKHTIRMKKCNHNVIRSNCKLCFPCSHNLSIDNCHICSKRFCNHGKRWTLCNPCNIQQCVHEKLITKCKHCRNKIWQERTGNKYLRRNYKVKHTK